MDAEKTSDGNVGDSRGHLHYQTPSSASTRNSETDTTPASGAGLQNVFDTEKRNDNDRHDNGAPLAPGSEASSAAWRRISWLPAPLPIMRRRLSERPETTPTTLSNLSFIDKQTYILRVCRGLIKYGAPSHRLETYMHRTADALQVNLQAFYLPSCMIISFDDDDRRSVDVQIITCPQSLNHAKLDAVHNIYKAVMHRKMSPPEASALLDGVVSRKDEHPRWLRVIAYGLASAFIGPVSYGARPIDIGLIFLLGSIVGLLDLVITGTSELYGYIFEMSSAILVSFVARALGSIQRGGSDLFCFSALAQASLVMILPGFIVTSSALELQSRMMISGAARLVYAIIYTLFLSFGFTVGITIYGAIDSNATSSSHCSNTWPFWWQVIFVAPFCVAYVIVNNAEWRQIPAMVVVTMAGWLVNHFSAQRFPTVQSLPNALGALTAGVLLNCYSRVAHGLALVPLQPAIFILVPGSFAASGSLISGLASANELTGQGKNFTSSNVSSGKTSALYAGYAMVEIAIGITAGLSISALLVYPIRKKRGKGGIFSY